ncbi:heme oxygenase [Methylobacterium sp. BE186]|uniref:biliverdin-producing heme oxygenase n=1 Tax=Methylobacterium sp. BE186 TaxID=2817715 RepID=UPI00285C5506|nr:biliverdin-producing heme oxygenase [Methylobacterium sp. BE186]MDR7036324.1 heme oxygenase [Methylobacterium sp. BE186]
MSAGSGLHARLRAETAAAHEALERDLDWEARVATLPGYRNLLARFHGFHAAYEPAIAEALGDPGFLDERRRLDPLAADLLHLGLDAVSIESLPQAAPPGLDGTASALGSLYVLEGSTLGGQVIGRRIAALHGFDEIAGCAYYRGRGARVGALWASFRARLDALTGEAEAKAASRAANATFEAMRVWLCRPVASAAA